MSSNEASNAGNLTVAPIFAQFIEDELLSVIGLDADAFWTGLESIITDLTPLNRALLEKRAEIQGAIDDWHVARSGAAWDHDEYIAFLKEIGYLAPEDKPFSVETENVDREIAEVAGPQLVVPVSNPRFAINAANARWAACTTPCMAQTRSVRTTADSAVASTILRAVRRLSATPPSFLTPHCP